MFRVFVFMLFCIFINSCSCLTNDLEDFENDAPQKDAVLNYSALENPFRVQKINLLWEKARSVLNPFSCHT